MSHERFQSCIDACLECATECDHCATECLHEKDIAKMARCIEIDRECAQACYAAARLMGIGGQHAAAFCNACAEICDACAEECENMRWIIANVAQKRAGGARKNAGPWQA